MHCTELGFRPSWASPPGETITDILEDRHLSVAQFANSIQVTVEQTKDLLGGYFPIDSALAERLETALGASKAFWMTRELQYRQDLARLQSREDSTDVLDQWLNELPLKDMIKFGWIPPSNNRAEHADECLRFFETPNVQAWRTKYEQALVNTAFRTSQTFDSHLAAASAWLRQGEREANTLECEFWNAEEFQEKLASIRQLTRKKDPQEFLPELQRICASCGVAVVVVRAPAGCRASGATKFLSPRKALLMLSFRYLSDDHFWFTFFHEAAHLLLHGKELVFMEERGIGSAKEEQEANQFSALFLVPPEFEAEMCALPLDARAIMRFARKIGVSAGIVVGQLQNRKILQHSEMNRLKHRFQWT